MIEYYSFDIEKFVADHVTRKSALEVARMNLREDLDKKKHNSIEKKIKLLELNTEAFDIAFETLSESEKDAITAFYLENNSSIIALSKLYDVGMCQTTAYKNRNTALSKMKKILTTM